MRTDWRLRCAVWLGNWDPLFEMKRGTRRKKHDSGTTIIISLVDIEKLSCNIVFPLDLASKISRPWQTEARGHGGEHTNRLFLDECEVHSNSGQPNDDECRVDHGLEHHFLPISFLLPAPSCCPPHGSFFQLRPFVCHDHPERKFNVWEPTTSKHKSN